MRWNYTFSHLPGNVVCEDRTQKLNIDSPDHYATYEEIAQKSHNRYRLNAEKPRNRRVSGTPKIDRPEIGNRRSRKPLIE